MNIKKHIPNVITLINLLCGCIALVFAVDLNFDMVFYFVALGIFFDFFDGFFARLFNVSSPLGLQLDSLADMVTSGVVPGFVMFFYWPIVKIVFRHTFFCPILDLLLHLALVIVWPISILTNVNPIRLLDYQRLPTLCLF